MAASTTVPTVTIAGGGLVGGLAAVMMAQRGFNVKLYEKRHDIRTENLYEGRSINLALSERGLAALRKIGLEAAVKADGIPMYGRMIHGLDGSQTPQPYGLHGEYIMSVDRRKLNETLLSAAEAQPQVEIHFDHTLQTMDLDAKCAEFRRPDHSSITVTSDVFIGADGAFSATRKEIMKKTRMNFMQHYIDHAYKELTIPAGPNDSYLLDNGHLHIWPRHSFMMIALPNKDKSFTCTLFMPNDTFDRVSNEAELISFFEKYFPDALPLMTRERLVRDYFKNPTGSLVYIKCAPYHYKGTAVMLGDAAHAMVPFYGQGMNAGFQDCLILDQLLDTFANDFSKALPEYTKVRYPDATAIVDLALQNYVEMRSKKKTEALLHHLAPKDIIPQYSMVSFTEIPYSNVISRAQRNLFFVNCTLGLGAFVAIASAATMGFVFLKNKL